jgi:hypothetical protein
MGANVVRFKADVCTTETLKTINKNRQGDPGGFSAIRIFTHDSADVPFASICLAFD